MSKKTKPENLSESELDDVQGGALLLPAVQQAREASAVKQPGSDNFSFGVERDGKSSKVISGGASKGQI